MSRTDLTKTLAADMRLGEFISPLFRAAFILDIEVELGWGTIDEKINKEALKKTAKKVRERLDIILNLLNQYSIPVTWGIVGHLILNRCEGELGVPHPEMPRPSYKWMNSDWYTNDPCKTLADEPAFYGKDIIDKIVNHTINATSSDEIACHSFSHQLFGDPGCSEVVAQAEVKRSVSLLKQYYGIRPRVFIFPRDSVGHLDILRKEGFLAFRGPISHVVSYSETERGIPGLLRKYSSLAIYFASFYLSISPPVVDPRVENELINIPASLCYNKKPLIPLSLIVHKAKKGIDRAVKEKKVFHLYTHLINFGTAPDPSAFIKGFESILAYANLKREENQLGITTIQRLAKATLVNRARKGELLGQE